MPERFIERLIKLLRESTVKFWVYVSNEFTFKLCLITASKKRKQLLQKPTRVSRSYMQRLEELCVFFFVSDNVQSSPSFVADVKKKKKGEVRLGRRDGSVSVYRRRARPVSLSVNEKTNGPGPGGSLSLSFPLLIFLSRATRKGRKIFGCCGVSGGCTQVSV